MGLPNFINSHYYATIDQSLCDACGVCADERCQVDAIAENESDYNIIKEKCIGCGLCVSTCPNEAIELLRKDPNEMVFPPEDENAWFDERARQRGVDYQSYK